MIVVTGGAGFIGSNFILEWLAAGGEPVLNVDALTYAGNAANLASVAADPRYRFIRADIADADAIRAVLREHRPPPTPGS
ncbi:MAG TPA: NAD-dependent epimerase/dehydratase family protein, partial [Burkholderiaceae bacterium]|nr:NAD-dependent epimerase/dehydratase family protein [Burkholderiaceae bacterium]